MKDKGQEENRPQRASTVILVRQGPRSIEVYLLKRSGQSDFMPGHYVFPGGRVDRADWDHDTLKKHVDLGPEGICGQLQGNMVWQETFAHCIAAVRETFEEAGVLLVRGNRFQEPAFESLKKLRMKKSLPENWLSTWVEANGWTLFLSALYPWAHWVTPEARSKRFDTRFFLSFMPQNQACMPDSRETTQGEWMTPEKALRRNLDGEALLSPPTMTTLHELLPFKVLGDLLKKLAVRSWGIRRLPRLAPVSRGTLILLPWDAMYNRQMEEELPAEQCDPVLLGQPFSRLWYHKGLWRPVRSRPGKKAVEKKKHL